MKTIHVLGIVGGPRNGNSAYLLERALDHIRGLKIPTEIQICSLRGKQIQPCIACHRCTTNGGTCILKDNFEDIRQQWIQADVILYSFPVFAQAVPGQLKCFIDRLGNSFYGKYEVGSMRHLKTVGAMTVGAHLFGGEELAINQIVQHALLLNCIPVSGDGPASYMGAPAWTRGDLGRDALKQLEAQGEADIQISLQAAASTAQRAVEVAAMLQQGAKQLQAILGQDVRYKPYLSRIAEEEMR